jgi:hypothetical protein
MQGRRKLLRLRLLLKTKKTKKEADHHDHSYMMKEEE